ncbi:uncharacterized protein LOC135479218 isoform X2 [Liolophura sinensis]|uniref:uncharacterized protein LOC135479218 isoform X2 n=1 Tax=Liolophura sinensis TaxID=3198878 RepID=UPI0031587FE3
MASVCSSYCQSNVTMDCNMSKVALEDCICPVCMCILIEPVTMPCQHELCMPCFKQNVEEASLTCPMCRTRISVWARQAARNHNLINKTRWKQIQDLFPKKVQRRLEGKDDDSSEEVFCAPKPQIAEPGEIRKEYEEQLRKMREQRRKEQEASERLIRELQEEEERKQQERKESLKTLESHDHELAQELSQAGTDVPINFLMQESQSRLTRSSSTNSNTDRHPSTLESFLERFKEKTQNKNGDPYPFQCFTPSEKEENGSKRASTSVSGLLTDKSTVRPDTLTVSSSSGQSLQEMFSPLSSVVPMSEGRSSDCTIIGEHVPHTAACSKLHDAGEDVTTSECPLQTSTNTQPKRSMLLEDILQAPDLNPLPWAKDNESATCSKYSEHSSGGSSEKQSQRNAGKRRRCPSAESNDSISPEISHFKPIQSCPRTPPRNVDGKLVDPPVVWTTPHNLKQLQRRSSSDDHQGLNLNECRSPAMQRRLRVLAEDRRRQVEANSKSTSTLAADALHAASVKRKQSSVSESRFCVSTSPFGMQAKPRAPCTISSETQLDVNSNESPCTSSVEYRDKGDAFKHNIPTWLNGVSVSDRVHSPDIDGVGKEGKHVLPLVSCVDDFDEFDGSPPMPEVSFLNKGASETKRNLFTTDVSSPEIKGSLPSVSRNLFQTIDGTSKTKSAKTDRPTTPVTAKNRGKLSKSKSRQNNVAKKRFSSPQMSLKDMFSRVQDIKKEHRGLGLSPCFASACSTPLADEGSVQMKSLINQALDSLERDDIIAEVGPKKSDCKKSSDLISMCGQQAVQEKCESDSEDLMDTIQRTINLVVASPENVQDCKRKGQRYKKNTAKANSSHPQTNTLDKFLKKPKTNVKESPGKKVERNVKRRRKRLEDPDYVCCPEDSDSGLDFDEVRSSQNDSKASKKSPKKSPTKRKKFKGYVWITDDEVDPSYEPPEEDSDISPEKTPKRSRRKTSRTRRKAEETPEKEVNGETKSDLEASPSRRLSGRKRRKPVYLYYDDTDEEASNDTHQSSRDAQVTDTSAAQPTCDLTNLKRQPLHRNVDTKTERMKNDRLYSSPEKCARVSKVSPKRKSKRSPLKGKSNLMTDGCVSCKESASSQKTENELQVANPPTRNLKRTRLTSSSIEKSPSKGRSCSVQKNTTQSETGCASKAQEELDRQLALQLQKEFELELRKSRIVDRSKGSSDEYSFRRRGKNLLSPVASHTRNRKSKK